MPLFYRSILVSVCTLCMVQRATSFAPIATKYATTTLPSDYDAHKNSPLIVSLPPLPLPSTVRVAATRPRPRQAPLMMSSEEQQNENDSFTCSVVVTTTAILGILSSLILLWSEASIVLTRCGPILLPDVIERSAYISTFIIASGTNLSKTIFGSSLTNLLLRSEDDSDYNSNSDGIQVSPTEKTLFSTMEVLSFLSVASAFGVLAWQVMNGDAFSDGAGMSGIDIRWCRLMNE